MNALHEQFVAEARELIHQATNDLIAVEREGASTLRIDRILRAFHTLKGSAGVVELPAMASTLHAAEDLLAAIHKGRLRITSEMIDQALTCLDQVSGWVDAFENHHPVPPGAGDEARSMVARLRDFLSDNPSDSRNLEDARSPADEGPLPGWVSHLLDQARADISRYLQGHARDVVAISYEPRPACFFDGDDPLALMRVLPSLLAFHAEPREPAAPLSELDPYTCNLRLWAIAGSSRAHVSTIFRLVPDQVRIVDIPWKALRAWMQGDQNDDPIGLVRAILEEQKRVLAASPGDDRAARIGAVGRTAINALRHHGRPELGGAIDLAMRSGVTEVAPLTSAIEAALASLANVVVSGDIEAEAVDRNSEAMVGAPAPARVLRVDEKKIDVLLNLASDLVVAKNSHALLASRIENELGRHTLARAVQQEHEAIERLSGEIHTAILQLRMVPVGQVLRLFPRLVRDMSQRLEKKAEFVTHG